MSTFSIIFTFLSIALYLYGFILYVYHIFTGKDVVPHPYSWTVWAVITTISTIQLVHDTHFSIATVSPIIRCGCLIIGAIAGWIFIRRIKTITIVDILSIIAAAGAILIAYYYGISSAIIPIIIIDFLVLLPSLRKIWYSPESEDSLVWVTTGLSQIFLMAAIPHITIAIALFWIYDMSINLIVGILIFFRQKFALKKKLG